MRLTERHLGADPPTAAEVAAARADIEAGIDLAASVVPLGDARTLVGLAGSVTTLAAMDARPGCLRPAVTHHYRLRASAVHELTERLLRMPRADRARIPVMHPGRVDVIGAGALILSAIVERLGEVLVSEHDILDGIAWSLVT